MTTKKLVLSEKQIGYIVLALESYVDVLRADEDDRGPSMADSLYVAHLAKQLREGTLTDSD